MADDQYPEQRPPFRPTMPTGIRMFELCEALVAAVDAVADQSLPRLQAAFRVPATTGEQRTMFLTAAGMAVMCLQKAAKERGCPDDQLPVTFTVPVLTTEGFEVMHAELAQAALNASASGDGEGLLYLSATVDVHAVVYATLALVHVAAAADQTVFTAPLPDGSVRTVGPGECWEP